MSKNLYKLSLLMVMFVVFSSETVFGADYRDGYGYTVEVKVTPYNRFITPESLIETPRVQLFSITPATNFNFNKGHEELEKIRTQCIRSNIDISTYTGLVLSENGSQYLRGQLAGFSTKGDADQFSARLKKIINTGPYAIPSGTVSQQGFTLKKAERHYWQ